MVIDGEICKSSEKKERNVQEENNGEHVWYIIRERKQVRLFSLYLPTKVKNIFDFALKMVRVIEVARIIDISSARNFTNTYEPRNLKTIC